MADVNALIPELDPISAPPDDVEEAQEEQTKALVNQDEQVASLLTHPGYAKIEERLNQYIDDYRSGKSMNFDKDTPLEQIGQKYVVASTVADICESLRDMVRQAAQSVAEDRKNRNGQ